MHPQNCLEATPIYIIAACVAKNQLLLSHDHGYFTVNKNLPDPSGPLYISKIVPSSSIEAANAKVSVELGYGLNLEIYSTKQLDSG